MDDESFFARKFDISQVELNGFCAEHYQAVSFWQDSSGAHFLCHMTNTLTFFH